MKNFIEYFRENLKLILILVAVSFFIFFMASLFGPVSFGRGLLRSLLFSMIMLFLIPIFLYVWEKFLGLEDSEEASFGKNVNITIDDEGDLDLNLRTSEDEFSMDEDLPEMERVSSGGSEDEIFDLDEEEDMPEIDLLKKNFNNLEDVDGDFEYKDNVGDLSDSISFESSVQSKSVAEDVANEIKATDFTNEEYAKVVRTILKKDD